MASAVLLLLLVSLTALCSANFGSFQNYRRGYRNYNDEPPTYRRLREKLESLLDRRQVATQYGDDEPCHAEADIVFILDESNSIPINDFPQQFTFVNEVIDMFKIGSDDTRIGVSTFGMTIKKNALIRLGDFVDNEPQMQATVREYGEIHAQNRDNGGMTNTHLALQEAVNIFSSNLARQDVSHIAILITDGVSREPDETEEQATYLKGLGVKLFCIGVGNKRDMTELENIASGDDYVFSVDTYDALDKLKKILAWKACEVVTTTTSTTTTTTTTTTPEPGIEGCDGYKSLDVLFTAPDEADMEATDSTLRFFESIVDKLVIDEKRSMAGLTPRYCGDLEGFDLNKYDDKDSTKNAIISRGLRPTELINQLEYLATYGFTRQGGARKDSTKFSIMVVDMDVAYPEDTIEEARRLKEEGINVITIGVGSNVNKNVLRKIASDDHFFYVRSYNDLSDIIEDIMDKLCKGISN